VTSDATIPVMCRLEDDKAFMVFQRGLVARYQKAVVLTVSGNTVTFNTEYDLGRESDNIRYITPFVGGNAVCYADSATFYVATISGTVVSEGPGVSNGSGGSMNGGIAMDANNIIISAHSGTSTVMRTLTRSGNIIENLEHSEAMVYHNDSYYEVSIATEGYNPDGSILWISRQQTGTYDLTYGTVSYVPGAVHVTDQYVSAITNAGGQIDSSNYTDLNSLTAIETINGQTAFFALSNDGRNTWQIGKSGEGTPIRKITSNQATIHGGTDGVLYINTDAVYGYETWAVATTDEIHAALEEAMATATNQMTGAQMAGVADSEWPVMGPTFDLAFFVRTNDSTTTPLISSVGFNYDGMVLHTLETSKFTCAMPTLDKLLVTAPASGGARTSRIHVFK